MKPARLLGLTVIWLVACTENGPGLYRSANQQKSIAHGLSVTITNVVNEAEALPFAEQYCKALGRRPQFDRMEIVSYHHIGTYGAVFDCVPRIE